MRFTQPGADTSRRDFLQAGAAWSLAFAAGVLKPAEVFGADWDSKMLDARNVTDAIRAFGGDVATDSDQVRVSGPEMVNSGYVVPVDIDSNLTGTDLMLVVVQKNPIPVTAAFRIPPGTAPSISTRIKMGESSTVYAIARANGEFYVSSTFIKVRAGGGGCG